MKALENSNNKVLWMSDTVDLLGQAIGSFEENNKLRELNYQLVCGTAITREKMEVLEEAEKELLAYLQIKLVQKLILFLQV